MAQRPDGRPKKLVALAGHLRERRAELRADFLHHYGVHLEDELARSPLCAADLAAMLPPGSCTMAAVDPELSWTSGEWLLAKAVDTLRGTAWALGVLKGDRPAPLMPPGCAPTQADADIEPFDIDEYKASHASRAAT